MKRCESWVAAAVVGLAVVAVLAAFGQHSDPSN